MRGKIIVLPVLFSCVLICLNSFAGEDQKAGADDPGSYNALSHFKSKLLNKEVWLKKEVLFGREWYGKRKDVTNVLDDGVWYRAHALAERDLDRFVIAAVNSKWGSSFCEEDYTPHVFNRGEKVWIFKVAQKRKNILVAYFMAKSGLKTGVFFDFQTDALAIPAEQADEFIERIFAFSEEELLADQTTTIALGMKEEEVFKIAGEPALKLQPEAEVRVFVYDTFKVVFTGGEVSEIVY